jgi:hypothetical protein
LFFLRSIVVASLAAEAVISSFSNCCLETSTTKSFVKANSAALKVVAFVSIVVALAASAVVARKSLLLNHLLKLWL